MKKFFIILSAVAILNLFLTMNIVSRHKSYAIEEVPKVFSIEYKV